MGDADLSPIDRKDFESVWCLHKNRLPHRRTIKRRRIRNEMSDRGGNSTHIYQRSHGLFRGVITVMTSFSDQNVMVSEHRATVRVLGQDPGIDVMIY